MSNNDSNSQQKNNAEIGVRIKDKELHRVVTTTIVYRPDFSVANLNSYLT